MTRSIAALSVFQPMLFWKERGGITSVLLLPLVNIARELVAASSSGGERPGGFLPASWGEIDWTVVWCLVYTLYTLQCLMFSVHTVLVKSSAVQLSVYRVEWHREEYYPPLSDYPRCKYWEQPNSSEYCTKYINHIDYTTADILNVTKFPRAKFQT